MRSLEKKDFIIKESLEKEFLEKYEFYSYLNIFDFISGKLKSLKIKEADIEAKKIILEIFKIDLAKYVLESKKILKIEDKQKEQIYTFLVLRLKRMPFQYILEKQNFYGLEFFVNENVLIPRIDTEVLVEKVLLDNKNKDISILDLCTGSGAIGICLKKIGRYKDIVLSDISKLALDLAKRNAIYNNVELSFVESNLLDKIEQKFDIIVSNPPYIDEEYKENLELEVRNYEPNLALYAKDRGLYFYKEIQRQIRKNLKKGGLIYFEIGSNQAEEIKEIFKDYKQVEIFKDLENLDRVAKIYT